ncbi:MAG: SDR family NAD(P)-dependent oxidoreductase [Nocardia sp.]|nr:SDR family NAD(P)-dependent oxidoreductase [Nocardia sp.]
MTGSATTALITGANKGLGHETARRLADLGWTVWLGARDIARGEAAAAAIRAGQPAAEVRPLSLDVTDDESVRAAYDTVTGAGTGLDVLVNNAGIGTDRAAPLDTAPADLALVYGVNVLGPVRVTREFLPLLRKSPAPRLVMVSSGLGSFGVVTDRTGLASAFVDLVYPSSKAALNMVTVMYEKALPDVRVTAVDPGYTATDLNGFTGTQTVAEGSAAIVTACTAARLDSGFISRHGAVPW